MLKKTYTAPIELKQNGQEGEFIAVFATLGVVDSDGDYTLPGAFENQAAVIEPWNHGWDLPAGKGMIKFDESKVWIDGQFFLDTEAGRENYTTVKNLGELAEWSYTFEIRDFESGAPAADVGADRILKKMDVWGVSPVTRGAGVDTHTVMIKAKKTAIRFVSTATTDSDWDGPANEARLRNDESADYYRRAYAWLDPDGDPESKSSYKFIHHMVSEDGTIGAANIRACQTGIGVLNGGRGGTTIPDSDRQGVYNHLAGHIKDADLEPPELKTIEEITAGQADSDESGAPGDEKTRDNTSGQADSDESGAPSGFTPEVIKTKLDILELEE